eukprot:COSAG01_NODE_240_length_20656_cov_53.398259_7_plen_194_part_00
MAHFSPTDAPHQLITAVLIHTCTCISGHISVVVHRPVSHDSCDTAALCYLSGPSHRAQPRHSVEVRRRPARHLTVVGAIRLQHRAVSRACSRTPPSRLPPPTCRSKATPSGTCRPTPPRHRLCRAADLIRRCTVPWLRSNTSASGAQPPCHSSACCRRVPCRRGGHRTGHKPLGSRQCSPRPECRQPHRTPPC